MGKDRKKRSVIGLLGCFCINNILYTFLNTFMVAYFIKLTNYDYKLISVYYVMNCIFIALTFYLLGGIVKNKTQVKIFRIGIVMYCIYILAISILKEKIIEYYIFLGICYGIVQGVLWAPGLSLVNEYVKDDSNNFVSLKSMLTQILRIIVPLILGASIEATSFSYIAKIILFFSITQFAFSLLINDKAEISEKKYNMKKFFKHIKSNKKMSMYYKLVACDGIVNYLLQTVVTILIVIVFKKVIDLGLLTSIFSLCSILSVYIFQRKLKNHKNILLVSAIMMIIGVISILIDINRYTIIIYNLFSSLFLVLLINNAETKRYNIVNKDKTIKDNYIVEHQVFSETCLSISRVIGYSVLFVASFFNNIMVFKGLLIIITCVIVSYAYLMIKLETDN